MIIDIIRAYGQLVHRLERVPDNEGVDGLPIEAKIDNLRELGHLGHRLDRNPDKIEVHGSTPWMPTNIKLREKNR